MTSEVHELESLYTDCMNCDVPVSRCTGVWKDIPGGVPPRGFFYTTTPVSILVVAKNPGHPFVHEIEALRGKSGATLFKAFREFQTLPPPTAGDVDASSGRYHRNLQEYLAFFLDLPEKELARHVAHTNLVKCSTMGEQAKLSQAAMEECFTTYLSRELKLFRPRVLLALGREVERFLVSKVGQHGLPVIYVKHPSYYYARAKRLSILTAIKAEIAQHLAL